MLVNLLKFFDSIMMDRQLHWKFSSLKEVDISYEFQWSKDEQLKWRYRKCGATYWTLVETENLPIVIDKLCLSQHDIGIELRRNILQQIVFADMVLNKGIDFFGHDTVNKAIEDNRNFMENLLDVIRKLTQKESSDSAADIAVHDQSQDRVLSKATHLRIVSPKNKSS